jgi:hypothetical protein
MPGYKPHGKPLRYFAGFEEDYSLFAASGTFFAALADELRRYELRTVSLTALIQFSFWILDLHSRLL